jgi:hypothetical protein
LLFSINFAYKEQDDSSLFLIYHFDSNLNMKKSQKRSIGVITILLMLGTSPLSVTYAFADFGDNDSGLLENTQRPRMILTEKVVDGKLQIQQYSLPDEFSDDDMQRMVSFEEESSSWAYVNYKALQSGIVLFDGKASKIGEDQLKISTNLLKDSQFGLELPENSQNENPEKELSYKVIFSGNIVNSDFESEKIIYFVNSILFPELAQNMKFLEFGEDLEKSDFSNDELRNSYR